MSAFARRVDLCRSYAFLELDSCSSVMDLATRVQEPHAIDRLDPALGEQLGGPPTGHPLAIRNREDLLYAAEDLPDLLLRPIVPETP